MGLRNFFKRLWRRKAKTTPDEEVTQEDQLRSLDTDTIPDFSFESESVYLAKMASCYDGDSVRFVFKFRGVLTRTLCRMYGIDTPELRTKNPQEKVAAIAAKNRLIELIGQTGQLVTVKFGKNDKYGRPLVTVFTKRNGPTEFENSVNWKMCQEGYAVRYDGGTKTPFKTRKEIT